MFNYAKDVTSLKGQGCLLIWLVLPGVSRLDCSKHYKLNVPVVVQLLYPLTNYLMSMDSDISLLNIR